MPVRTRIYSGTAVLFEGDCDFITLRGADGDFGVLPSHAPLLTWLKPGEVMLRQGERERYFFAEMGFVEVLPQRVTILVDGAQPSADLDLGAVEEARRRAQEQLSRSSHDPHQLAEAQRELEVAEQRSAAAERERRRRRD